MALSTARFTLAATTPTKIVSASTMTQFVTLHNLQKNTNNYIYYGASNVSSTNSPHLDPGETLKITLLPLEELFAVSDPDNLLIGVMTQRQD